MDLRNNKNRLDSGHKGFRIAYDNLPCKQQRKIRRNLMDRLDWSVVTFYNKTNGVTPIWKNESEIIAEEFKSVGLDAWTGETIFFK